MPKVFPYFQDEHGNPESISIHNFSMQVVISKCFLLNPEKNLAKIRLVVFEKYAHFNSEITS